MTARIKDWLLAQNIPAGTEPLLTNTSGQRYKRSAPHAIRHTLNMVAREQSVDVLTRSKLLNHSDTRTQSSYSHVHASETSEARDQVRAALKGGIGRTPDSSVEQKPLIETLRTDAKLPQ